MPKLLQKQTLNLFQKHAFGFFAVLKRARIMPIPQSSTFWTKSTKIAKKKKTKKKKQKNKKSH